MKILYCDCFFGISGDMLLGAFLDIGVDKEYLTSELSKLPVEGFRIKVDKIVKKGIYGTNCKVIIEKKEQPHRHLSDICNIIEESALSQWSKTTSTQIFRNIAEVEAMVHHISVEQVHFHEIGALDSIIDIIGAVICFESISADKIYTSAVNVGKGIVKCAHGLLPVPAPATLAITKNSTIPVYSVYADGETATPTGMAILNTMAEYTEELPFMQIDAFGYGFGDREYKMLNGLRLIIGHTD